MNHLHSSNCGCSSEISTDNLASLYNLYSKINKEAVECLNENVEDSGKEVFRPWDQRLLKDKVITCLTFFIFFLFCLPFHTF